MSTVLVTHQLPGDRFKALAAEADVTVWMGPGLISREVLSALSDQLSPRDGR